MNKSISILGCGWLGLPLAKTLVESGYQIDGSTTQPERLSLLEKAGIRSHIIEFSPEINRFADRSFFENDMMIINIPPSRRRDDIEIFYPQQIAEILKQIPTSKIIFVSSTSVYPNLNREVTESDIPVDKTAIQSLRASGRALIASEKLIQQYSASATIVRLAGLMGPERHPGRFLAGKKLNGNGQAPVNYIHLDDCLLILNRIIRDDIWGEVLNACADKHPPKEKFYQHAAQRVGQEPPEFTNEAALQFKLISNQKLKEKLNYRFKYSNPLDAL